jgi:uncharacterized protein YndB with AHSA1/START domain
MKLGLSVLILASPPPLWALQLATLILYGLMAVMLIGLVIPWMPIWKPLWVLEQGSWLIVVSVGTVILLSIGLVIQLNVAAGALLLIVFLAYIGYWVPRSRRVVEAKAEAVVAASPEAVFALATDPSAIHRLHPDILSAHADDGRPTGVGSRIRARSRSGRIEGVDLVVEFDAPHRYADRTLSGAPANSFSVTFTPSGGGTLIHWESRHLLPFPMAVISGYRKPGISRQLIKTRQRWVENVRRELETRA